MHTDLRPGAWQPYKLGLFRQLLPVLAHLDGADRRLQVLEVGFGKGTNTIALASYLPHVTFYAVDLVPEHAVHGRELARKAGVNNVIFLEGNMADPPALLLEQQFDMIFGIESFCHLDTDGRLDLFLSFAAGALRAAGKIVVVDGFRTDGYSQLPAGAQLAMKLAESGFRVQRMASKSTWESLGHGHGFIKTFSQDLTESAIPFWKQGWRVANVVLQLPWLARWFINSSPARLATAPISMPPALPP